MSDEAAHLEGKPLCLDWQELTSQLPDGCVDLLFLDPPYNIGVFCKMPPGKYLDWCGEWIAEGDRVLKPNGAFWVSHKNLETLVDISREITQLGRKRINWVTWDKFNGNPTQQICGGPMIGMTEVGSLRSFQVMADYLIYHADEGDWTTQCDRERGFIFEPLRKYLASEWRRAELTSKDANEATGTQMAGHYLTPVQWTLPTRERYEQLRAYANRDGGEYLQRDYEDLRREYEHLRREYEDLRQEYEHLRYTFNNPGKLSSVWQIPPAPKSFHPTPKPERLFEIIIETTSNPGDLMLDFFAGSFTTAAVAQRLGRRWIACDVDPTYCRRAGERLQANQLKLL